MPHTVPYLDASAPPVEVHHRTHLGEFELKAAPAGLVQALHRPAVRDKVVDVVGLYTTRPSGL